MCRFRSRLDSETTVPCSSGKEARDHGKSLGEQAVNLKFLLGVFAKFQMAIRNLLTGKNRRYKRDANAILTGIYS
jgi:hypothetical protein